MSTQTKTNSTAGFADPHQQWLEEWKVLRAKHLRAEEETTEESELWNKFCEIERKICSTPATTQAGVCAQLEWIVTYLDDDDWVPVRYCKALTLALVTLKGGLV